MFAAALRRRGCCRGALGTRVVLQAGNDAIQKRHVCGTWVVLDIQLLLQKGSLLWAKGRVARLPALRQEYFERVPVVVEGEVLAHKLIEQKVFVRERRWRRGLLLESRVYIGTNPSLHLPERAARLERVIQHALELGQRRHFFESFFLRLA